MARRSSQQWAELVERWKHSGQSATAFGESVGVDSSQLHWWKWHLKARAANRPMAIVPVRVVPSRKPAVVAEPAASTIEVLLPSGAQLRIGCGVDEATLARVVRALESACS